MEETRTISRTRNSAGFHKPEGPTGNPKFRITISARHSEKKKGADTKRRENRAHPQRPYIHCEGIGRPEVGSGEISQLSSIRDYITKLNDLKVTRKKAKTTETNTRSSCMMLVQGRMALVGSRNRGIEGNQKKNANAGSTNPTGFSKRLELTKIRENSLGTMRKRQLRKTSEKIGPRG